MSKRTPDRGRFAALVEPHFDALYGAARRLTFSPSDAEDLVQDVCLKAFESIDELQAIEYRRAWLLKVLYHKFVDRQRAKARSPVDQALTGADSFAPDSLTASAIGPDEQVDKDTQAARIMRAMSILGEEECSLLALRDIEEYSLEELQVVTGMPKGTIKSRLHRTRSKLGRLLSNKELQQPFLRVVDSQK